MLYGEVPASGGFPATIQNPPKKALLRLPTSAEIIAYQDQQKMVRRPAGRGGASTTESLPNEKADLELFAALRVDKDGLEFDAAEARRAIGRLTSVRVVNSERDGDRYLITLATPFGEVTHSVGIPTEKQLSQFRPVVSKDLRHGNEEMRYRTQSGVDLYDAVSPKADGYAEGVEIPAHHKFSVATELARELEESAEVFDPNL